jgi:hypothetical protein
VTTPDAAGPDASGSRVAQSPASDIPGPASDTPAADPSGPAGAGERTDLLESLRTQRHLLLHTVDGLTDEQAATRTTVSELTLGGLVKHVASMENRWCTFVEQGPAGLEGGDDEDWVSGFRMVGDETLDSLVERFHQAADRTDALVESLPDLDVRQPLPRAPWFQPGATRSARRVFLHLVAEIAQHAGHADILREAIDGQKTMG